MTTRSRTYSTQGVVVRQRDIGEADRLLWIITPDHGIIRAVARSARKPGSKLGGHIDLLRHVALSMRTGRTLDQVSQAETVSGFISLRQDLVRATTGSYVAELAERFSVEGGSNRQLFDLLVSALGYLQTTERAQWLPRWFELRLLSISGFMPELYACVDCGGELVQVGPRLFVGARRPGLPRLPGRRQRRSAARKRRCHQAAALPAHRRVGGRRAVADQRRGVPPNGPHPAEPHAVRA